MEAQITAMTALVEGVAGGPLLLRGKVTSGSALDTALIRKEGDMSECDQVSVKKPLSLFVGCTFTHLRI
jgi:hypothetical protein